MYKVWWWPGLTSWSDSAARIPSCSCHLVWALDTCWGSWDTPHVQKHLVCKHTSETSPSVASNVCCNPGSAMCFAFRGIPVASKCADSVTINIINTERIWSIKNRLLKLCNLMIQVGLLNDISMLRKVWIRFTFPCLTQGRIDVCRGNHRHRHPAASVMSVSRLPWNLVQTQ